MVLIFFKLFLILFQSNSVNICNVTEEVKQALKEFRFRKDKNTAALICK